MKIKKSEWKCGNCGKTYSIQELIGLSTIKAVESDTDPKSQHGYTSVCDCGYRFHLDRWRLHDTLKIKINDKEVGILVSTVYLELNNGFFDKDLWYETMIFSEEDNIMCNYTNTYETKDEAINDHNKILDNFKNGKYIIEKNEKNDDINIVLN